MSELENMSVVDLQTPFLVKLINAHIASVTSPKKIIMGYIAHILKNKAKCAADVDVTL